MCIRDSCHIDDKPGKEWGEEIVATLDSMPDITMLPNTSVSGYYEQNYLTLLETTNPNSFKNTIQLTRQRLWKVRAKQVILATGMIERPLVFANNDRPGIMLSSAIRTYINEFGVTPGQNPIVFTNNDDAYRTAITMRQHNINVVAIVDVRENPDSELFREAKEMKIPIHLLSLIHI